MSVYFGRAVFQTASGHIQPVDHLPSNVQANIVQLQSTLATAVPAPPPAATGVIDGIPDGAYGGEGVGYMTQGGHRYVIQQAVTVAGGGSADTGATAPSLFEQIGPYLWIPLALATAVTLVVVFKKKPGSLSRYRRSRR